MLKIRIIQWVASYIKELSSWSFSFFVDWEFGALLWFYQLKSLGLSGRFELPKLVLSEYLNEFEVSSKTRYQELDGVSAKVILDLFRILDFVSHLHNILCSLLNEDSLDAIFRNTDFDLL